MIEMTTDARAVFASLRELTAARNSLPVDWSRFNRLFGGFGEAETLEDSEDRMADAVLGARTADMTAEQASDALDLMCALAEVEDDAAVMTSTDLCALLRELAADASDLEGLWLALTLARARFNLRECLDRIPTEDAADSPDPNGSDRLRAECVKVLQASATAPMDDDLAAAIWDAIGAWHALYTKTSEQKEIRAEFEAGMKVPKFTGETLH